MNKKTKGPVNRMVSGPFTLGPFTLIIKMYFNEHSGYFNLKQRSNDIEKY